MAEVEKDIQYSLLGKPLPEGCDECSYLRAIEEFLRRKEREYNSTRVTLFKKGTIQMDFVLSDKSLYSTMVEARMMPRGFDCQVCLGRCPRNENFQLGSNGLAYVIGPHLGRVK